MARTENLNQSAKILTMLAGGEYPSQIAKKFGITRQTLYEKLKKLEKQGYIKGLTTYKKSYQIKQRPEVPLCSQFLNADIVTYRKYSSGPEFRRMVYPKIPKKMLRCSSCGTDDRVVLHLHHIDRNPKNNTFKNLTILCANCHAKLHRGVKIELYSLAAKALVAEVDSRLIY